MMHNLILSSCRLTICGGEICSPKKHDWNHVFRRRLDSSTRLSITFNCSAHVGKYDHDSKKHSNGSTACQLASIVELNEGAEDEIKVSDSNQQSYRIKFLRQ